MLINPGTLWPPPGHETMRYRWNSWAAWWSGDLNRLKQHAPATAPGGYWARRATKPGSREIHVPLAADLARTSAELVAGDTPAMNWGDTKKDETSKAVQTEWDALAQNIGWASSLLEAAEVAAATGGVYLRPAWDDQLAEHPLLTIVRADEALPEFRFGILRSVTFVQELPAPDDWVQLEKAEVWRWLEHHEPGQIRHELWLGNAASVGALRPLADHPATANLLSVINTTSVRPKGILAEYIPNDLPQPLDRLPLGRSDFQGVESLLDALDEVFDSWMRDIQLGKARILASKEAMNPVSQAASEGGRGLFKRRGNTTAAKAFDTDAEVFEWMDIPGEDSSGKPMPFTQVQFDIRYEEHEKSALALIEQIVSRAGYSPQTFGLNVDGQLSGTAMRRRDHRSHKTKDRKRRYARPALERCAETLMLINAAKFRKPKPTDRPTLEWRETDQADPLENAQVIELLTRARRLSLEVGVAMAHPEWDGDQVEEEVKRLQAEQKAEAAASPMSGFEPGPFGDGNKPPADKPPAAPAKG